MANNLVLNKDVDLKKLNESKGDDIYALNIVVKTQKTKTGGTFKKIDVWMFLPTYKDVEENGMIYKKKFLGNYNRKVSLHFRQNAFNNVVPECAVKSINDLVTGTLFVRKKSVKPPKEYYVEHLTKEDGTIETKFPECWIHSDIVGFIAYTPDDSIFSFGTSSGIIEDESNDDSVVVENSNE